VRRTRLLLALVGATGALAWSAMSASAEPLIIRLPAHFTQPPTNAQCEQAFGIACYGPKQIEQAYDMGPLYRAGLTGAGKTIVIVDSFGSPTIQQDLQVFDKAYGLPAPPSLDVITPDGPVNFNDPAAPGWAGETTLDVEYSHALAPGANILLVETPVAETEGITGFPQIVEAENYVINRHLGDVITQSFGATEQTFASPEQLLSQRSDYINALFHRVTVLAASGDAGATDYELDGTDFYPFRAIDWPSSDPLVTSVGGTQLHLDAFGNRTQPDNVWNDPALPQLGVSPPAAGGGGLSTVFRRPFYQDGVRETVDGRRGTPDVSMSAACNGAVLQYESFPPPAGWSPSCGTSEASPSFAGVVAVADQAAHRDLGLLNPALYALGDDPGSGLVDVTRGNNTVTFTQPSTGATITVPGFNAVDGYDLASGLGTPDGARLVAQLAGYREDHHRR
jgi:subtilase family serine protease